MDYLTSAECAEKWNVSQRWVAIYCKEGRIEGAIQKGRMWFIPVGTEKPGAYVGVALVEDDGVDFEERMAEIHRELLSLQAESNDLMDTISKNMKEMGL